LASASNHATGADEDQPEHPSAMFANKVCNVRYLDGIYFESFPEMKNCLVQSERLASH
jgi:hypothetical protein